MKILLFGIIYISFTVSVFSQSTDSQSFITLGGKPVSQEEFERIYNKNNSFSTAQKQTVDEYLQMFINFKLKVRAAEDAGFDTLSSFRNELKGYRDQLAKSYLTDNALIDSFVQEAYLRMHTEVSASHILIGLKMNPAPSDTLAAWNKIMQIRQRILAGESFEKLAVEFSEDPSAKRNKGYLGYFSAFQMVYPFESAAYNNHIGEISLPVRTKFGYHLVKTLDKRPAHGEVKVAHIMVLIPQGAPDSVALAARKKINSLKAQLDAGADFSSLARSSSEDGGTARNGGILPAFGVGRMVPEFEEAAFKLQSPGDISEPVRTAYGWHIIRLIEKKEVPAFDKVKQELKNKVQHDERAEVVTTNYLNSLKRKYGFSENITLLPLLYTTPENLQEKNKNAKVLGKKPVGEKNQVVKLKSKLNLDLKAQDLEQTVFQYADQKIKLGDFAGYLKSQATSDTTISGEQVVAKAYAAYVRGKLLNYEDSQLDTQNKDFKDLIREYHDGILLFNLSDSLVWSKSSKDSVGLQHFFAQNNSQYTWPERLDARIVSCNTIEIAKKSRKLAHHYTSATQLEQDLHRAICDSLSKNDCLQINSGKFAKGDQPVIDSLEWKKGISEVFKKDGKWQFVVIYQKLAPAPKELNETKGLVISDYQNYLESEWIKALKLKYTVSVNQEVLNQLKAKYANPI